MLAGMAIAAPIFVFDAVFIIDRVLLFFALVVQGISLVHAITQRSDAFAAIGTLPKGAGSPSWPSACCSPCSASAR